jgi:hypothetical protein
MCVAPRRWRKDQGPRRLGTPNVGCSWRIVTCQFRGKHVLFHHNGNTATMKRKAFKALAAAIRAARPKRPRLRLVVSNPSPLITRAKAA